MLCACGDDRVHSYSFGPYSLAPGQEVTEQCVSVTLHNERTMYINSVEFTSTTGFHHSNWFYVGQNVYGGEDGTWPCAERQYSEAVAGTLGGVLFAQSTQSPHEIQQFADGVAIVIPDHSKIVAGT